MKQYSSENPIKVLVVDDSPLVRTIMTRMLVNLPEFELVGTAANGKAALEMTARLHPDVITMDIEMPEMNGLEALAIIMDQMPTPVIIMSAHSKPDAGLTIRALELGAFDFVTKPHPIFSRKIVEISDEITMKLRTASLGDVKRNRIVHYQPSDENHQKWKKPYLPAHRTCKRIISIGVSTGGPTALKTISQALPHDIDAAILIVQHMPVGFTKALADRLNEVSRVEVKEAEDGDPIVPGRVFLARGGYHLCVEKNSHHHFLRLNRRKHVSFFRPSIDVLMQSTAEHFTENNIGVIMTGMSADGVEGVRAIKRNRGIVIAQDEETSAIFGMNKLAIQSGMVDHIVPLERIVPTLLRYV
jgi:two-component system chemotaxis response regulator CheB